MVFSVRFHRWKSLTVLLVALALCSVVACDDSLKKAENDVVWLLPPRPGSHVVVISFDALRSDALGSYGYPRATSPHIDAFAAEAVQFDESYAVAPETPTSFAGAFTGRFPNRDFRDWRLISDQTLAALFREAGYQTAAFLNNPQLVDKRGFAQGFDSYSFYTMVEDEQVVNDVGRFLEQERDHPLFMWIHLIDPHSPWVKRDTALHLYDEGYEGSFEERVEGLLFIADPQELTRARSLYDGEIFTSDLLFGRIIELLRTSGVLSEAFVVLTSDHGEEFMEHGRLQHGQLTEENVRIPLLIRHPVNHEGARVSRRASNIDLLPTLAALVGIEPPEGLDGRSLLLAHDPDAAIVAIANTEDRNRAASIFVQNLKLIVHCGDRRESELFDLVSDPGERENLAAARPTDATTLETRLWSTLDVEGCDALDMKSGPGHARETRGLREEEVEALKALGYLE